MADKGLRELYIDELKDLYSAENQLVKALPKMAKGAHSEELRQGFEEHLEQTKGHVLRLEEIFEALRESPKGKKCKGMEGLIEEGAEVLDEDYEGSILDLGESQHVAWLTDTLEEEKETDEKLTELAQKANTGGNAVGEPAEPKSANGKDRKPSKRVA